MIEGLILIVVLGVGFILWKTGLGTYVTNFLGINAERAEKWLKDEEGYWVNLPEKLPFREFDQTTNTVETENGWLWAAVEMSAIPTDGYSRRDWWSAGVSLNRIFAGLPDHSQIQIHHKIGDETEYAEQVFRRNAAEAPDEEARIIALCRGKHLMEERGAGRVRTRKIRVYLGLRAQTLEQKLNPLAAINPTQWVDLEKEAFEGLYEDLKLGVEDFVRGVAALGAHTRLLTAQEIKNNVFAAINPAHPLAAAPNRSNAKKTKVNARRGLASLADELEAEGLLDKTTQETETLGSPVFDLSARFSPSPREEVCSSRLRIKSDLLALNDTPLMIISLKMLPVRTFAGLMERLTRAEEIDFPFEVISNMEISDTQKKIREYETEYGNTLTYLTSFFSASEREKKKQLESVCEHLSKGEEKTGRIGLAVCFSGSNVKQIRKRQRLIMSLLRSLENLEGYAEWTHPLDQFIATLPCGAGRDRRRRDGLTRDMVGISPLTGPPTGVSPDDAIDVFQAADGGLVYVNPGSQQFNSGTSVFIGAKRSGKSAMLNRQRTTFRIRGRRGVSIDFGGSASRVCAALGGYYVDITKAKGLGLFSIKPEPGERYGRDELNENGFPKTKLAEVQNRLEILCLEAKETELPKRLLAYLYQGAENTYARLEGRTPRIDDFITTFQNALDDDKELGKELAARLSIYRSSGSFGHLLNDSEGNQLSTELPYVVFDFAGAISDPRLMLVGTMAVDHYTKRLLRTDRKIAKFIDVDEFSVISDDYRLCKMIEIIVRTDSKSNCICSIASQDAADFYPATSLTNDPRRAIRASTEIFWIFNTPKPDVTADVLGLSAGVKSLLYKLDRAGGESHRDCAYIYPGGVAHLRLRNGALDRRLLLGAGRERATLEDALADASAVSKGVPPRLARALAMDGLSGALKSVKEIKPSQKPIAEEIDLELLAEMQM